MRKLFADLCFALALTLSVTGLFGYVAEASSPWHGSGTIAGGGGADKLSTALATGPCTSHGCFIDLSTQSGVTAGQIQNVFPSVSPGGATGSTAVTDTWSSCAEDTANSIMYCHGGGHTDYAGNEVYKNDLKNSLNWVREFGPSTADTGNTGYYVDSTNCTGAGCPASVHTYGALVYVPSYGLFRAFGAIYISGNEGPQSWLYLAGHWTQEANTPSGGSPYYESSFYNPTDGNVYFTGQFNGTKVWTPSTNAWVYNNNSSPPTANYYGSAMDVAHQRLWMIGNGYAGYMSLTGTLTNVTTTGNQTCQNFGGSPGVVYRTVDSKIWCIIPGSTTAYNLNTTTFAWTAVTANGSNAVTPSSLPGGNEGGMFNRAQYDSAHDAIIIVVSTQTDMVAYIP